MVEKERDRKTVNLAAHHAGLIPEGVSAAEWVGRACEMLADAEKLEPSVQDHRLYTYSLIEAQRAAVDRAVEVVRYHRLSLDDVERLAALAHEAALERLNRMTAEEAALIIHEAIGLGVAVEVAP